MKSKSLYILITLFAILNFQAKSQTILNVPDDYATIQSAIDAASDGNVVLVQPGVYQENINFNGKNITVSSLYYSTNDVSYVWKTIIDGSRPEDELNASVVIIESGETEQAKLSGFTLRRGSGSYRLAGYGYNYLGAGIFVRNASPVLEHLYIVDNVLHSSNGSGAGIFFDGGGIVDFSFIKLERNYNASGIDINSSNGTFQNITANSNSKGIDIFNSTIEAENVIICDNVDCGLFISETEIHLNKALITNNGAEGINLWDNSDLVLTNSTIANNFADNSGGAAGIYAPYNATAIIVNSIFQNNYPNEIDGEDASFAIAYSNIRGGEAFIYSNNVEWLEGNIQNNPFFFNPVRGDFQLTPGSPCINAGIAFYEYGGNEIVNIPPEQYTGPAPDMGYYLINEGALISEFTVEKNIITVGEEIQFTDESYAIGTDPIGSYQWIFGDGGMSTLQNPIHAFEEPGFFTVALAVFNNDTQDTKTKELFIEVYEPQEINISTTGNDITGDGSVGNPYATFQHAIDISQDYYATVIAQPGTYNESIRFKGKNITVGSLFLTTQDESYISSTIIDGSTSAPVVTFDLRENENAQLVGLTITGGAGGINVAGVLNSPKTNPGFQNLIIRNNSGSGVTLRCSDSHFQNIEIRNNTTETSGGGVNPVYSKAVFVNVLIADNQATHFVTGNGGGIASSYETQITLINSSIINNTAAHEGGGLHGNEEDFDCPVFIAENCIIAGNSPNEIKNWNLAGSEDDLLESNYTCVLGMNLTGTGNISDDPMFVDPGNEDYHLQQSSPCVDSGNPLSDFSLEPEPNGNRINMGCFGNTVHASQSGNFLSVEPAFFLAEKEAGEFEIELSTTGLGSGDIDWTTATNDEWITITDGTSGQNNGSILVEYEANTEFLRTGTITISATDATNELQEYTITIEQKGRFGYIQAMIDAASDGDTIIVLPGFYEEDIDFKSKDIILASKFLATQNYSYVENTIIHGSGGLWPVVTIHEGFNSNTQLIGFTIENGDAGIEVEDANVEFHHLIIKDNDARGFDLVNSYAKIENVVLYQNDGGAIYAGAGSNLQVINTTITNNTFLLGAAMRLETSNCEFVNTIVWGNTSTHADYPQDLLIWFEAYATFRYCDIEGGETNISNNYSSYDYLEGNIDTDPLFIDEVNYNYRLQEISACIDAGDPNFPLDPNGSNIEIGAFAWFLNSIPTDIELSSNTIEENLPVGTLVGEFTTIDADPLDIHMYTLSVGGSNNESFYIDNNKLYSNEIFDFETQNSYDIIVMSDDGNGGQIEKDFEILIDDIATGHTINRSDKDILIYPNPANDFVNIKSENTIEEISVYNQLGQLITFEKNDTKTCQIITSEWRKGIYIFEILTSNKKYFKRIIKN